MEGKIVVLKKSYYEILEPRENTVLDCVKHAYKSTGADAALATWIKSQFASFSDPFVLALKLSYCSGDFHSSKNKSLALFIMSTLSEWLSENMVDRLGDPKIKLDALRLMLEQRNNIFRDLVMKVFNMTADRQEFIPLISELVTQHKYKEACQVANTLKLNGSFSFDEFLLPLCVQDKIGIVEEYVASDKTSLYDFLTYLDGLVANHTYDTVAAIMREKNVPNWSGVKCGHKPFIKLMARLIKKYNVPQSHCPKMEKRRKRSALHYLLATKFSSADDLGESWSDMLVDAVGEDYDLRFEVVRAFADRNNIEEGIEWATRFQIPRENWPDELTLDTSLSSSDTPEPTSPQRTGGKSKDPSFEFLKLPFSTDKIILVDTKQLFMQFLQDIKQADIVGIDAEWKPSLVTQNALSLIQVATYSEVYIIDRMVLAESIPEELAAGLIDGLFHNRDLRKLGFDFKGDLKALKDVIPGLKDVLNLVDMSNLRKVLKEKHKLKFPYQYDTNDGHSGGKLKNLIEMCCNKTLNKSEQCSNWERRPLRPSQIEYAALDAYCLLEAYHVIEDECNKQGIALNEVSTDPEQFRTTRRVPDDHCFICTWELALLYKRLRRCGYDTLYVDSRNPNKRIMKLLRQGYILLTTVRHTWLTRGIRLCMVPRVHEKAQLEEVFKKYKLTVEKEQTVTRCSDCNETELTELPIETVRQLRDFTANQARTACGYLPPEEVDQVGYDDDDYDDDYGFEEDSCAIAEPLPAQAPNRWTVKGAVIQADKVPQRRLDNTDFDTFYVCDACGHVSWPTTTDDMFLYE